MRKMERGREGERVSKRQKEKGQCHYFKMGTESQWRDTQTGHVMIKTVLTLFVL